MKLNKLLFKSFLLITLSLFLTSSVFAQNQGRILGRVIDAESSEPLPGSLIKIQKTNIVTFSNRDGKFVIHNLKSGNYFIECILMMYPRFMVAVHVPAKGDTSITIKLSQSSAESDVFEIGGIQVEAERELMPRDYAATTRISSGEVENLQASSLGDVLEMIPGLEKTNRLGLDKSIHANICGESNDRLGTFGTKIILDEAPFSNNANMQMSAGGTISTSAGWGLDLRLIPADNIESVEVIRGVPSAKYGDLTSGIIKVKTKTGVSRPRLKLKSNPNTTEANFGAGYELGKNVVNMNFNYGYSERSLRKECDEFHRINVTLINNRQFLNNTCPLNLNFL